MVGCLNCDTTLADERPMYDAYACLSCRMIWCPRCTEGSGACPTCQGTQVIAVTLTDDAYL